MRLRRGMIVAIEFDDHSERVPGRSVEDGVIRTIGCGVVLRSTRKEIILAWWHLPDETQATRDLSEGRFSVARKAIRRLRVLPEAWETKTSR